MPFVYRLAMPALCLSLILPCAFSVKAADPAPAATAEKPAEDKSVERQPLLERSQEEAAALERLLPAQELQQLQAGSETFLALWKPANTAEPKGAVIIIPGAGETADWPQAIGPLRRKLPDAQWSSLSITLPDLQSDAIAPRVIEPAAAPKAPESGSKDSTTAQPIEQAAGGEAEVADQVVAETTEEQSRADAERIFARIDAAIAYAEQQSARSIVVLGHGTGAYWAARYLNEKQTAQVEKFVMVDAQAPAKAKPPLAELTPTLKLPTADIFYMDKPLDRNAALERMQASKRLKTSAFSQVALKALPDKKAEGEQLLRRVRGWLNPQSTD
ncbi:alpha/beta hydrolase family protein [Pseudomonas granadensis]|uniref:Alpha/beta hydrolase family protein n=1 Tax=Pseudomonas granadensis TaxID=1421430 RepID=A0ABX7GEV1_9PSED|nr:alpha/beta hydrolase family protein [Pseudomonas granadensis]MBN6771692.1 alpha/beta hydrolase family protein [Pseudomonas granadensis]MBN6803532.1 alpha/beta hydrolase family protein [Pseudomonas granadensis]MBN6829543.1 alpha/beta hydrolase family protein [Pseudomonas granadensis]MBN6837753.1 alpha/beta hydrolase family protein [Pseudomonas granadensis]MBN6866399.1 alpha/beta hydrolase family protein [Pseudomonas granadensis]